MHGTIFAELRKYVDSKFPPPTWSPARAAGITHGDYDPLAEYPDAEAVALLGAATRATGRDAAAILEDFGYFIAPDLIEMYWSLVPYSDWRTLDLIENTEETIHKLVRVNNPGARPPQLRVVRTGPDELVIHYDGVPHVQPGARARPRRGGALSRARRDSGAAVHAHGRARNASCASGA